MVTGTPRYGKFLIKLARFLCKALSLSASLSLSISLSHSFTLQRKRQYAL
jgi:hypothetical protein